MIFWKNNLNLQHLVFQIYKEQCLDIFEIPYYKSLKKWLTLSGLYPPKNIIIILVAISIVSVTLPLVRKQY